MAIKDQESLFQPFKPKKYQSSDIDSGVISSFQTSTLAPHKETTYTNPENKVLNAAEAGEISTPPAPPSTPTPKFDSDYQALLDYATSQGYTLPTEAQQFDQNNLVQVLKTNDIWQKLDLFYLFMTDGDEDFAGLNWKSPSTFKINPVNSPTFTTNIGYTGNATDQYLETGWATTSGSNYTQNNASHGVFTNNHRGSNFTGDVGYHGGGSNPYAAINYYNADFGVNGRDGFYINTNSAVNLGPLITTFRATTLNNSTQQSFRGSNSVGTSVTSQPLQDDPIYIMQRGIAGSNWYAPSNVQFKADFWGGYLTQVQITALVKSLENYESTLL
jgi:hypothetical protein